MTVQKLSHQDIDWDAFSLFEDDEFKIFSKKIHFFFQAENINFSDKEIYALFGSLISEFALLKFVSEFEKKTIINNKWSLLFHPSLLIVEIFAMYEENCWIDLGFFHRHPIFQETFEKNSSKKIIKLDEHQKKISLAYLKIFRKIVRYGLFQYGLKLVKRIVFVLVNRKILFRKSKTNILGSAHGIYTNIGAMLLCSAIKTNGKIILNQPGFFHLQAKYIYQVKYELNVATKYIGWGGSEKVQKNRTNIEDIGSMYAFRANKNKVRVGALVLLPQVPRENYRGFSFYWMSRSDFLNLLPELTLAISKLQKKHKKLILRCKSVDKYFYQALLRRTKLDVHFQSADVNQGEEFDAFEKTYVTYFSTSIVEAFYKGSNVQLIFKPQTYLVMDEIYKHISFFNTQPTDQKKLDEYLSIFAKPTMPEQFVDKLNNIINS